MSKPHSSASSLEKPRQAWWQIVLMCIGFFGIQHGFSIQFANMSVIYEKLGVQSDQIPFLWLAAPMTGLLVTPIIGYMSDRTWGPLGRRRPYFLAGAILAALAMLLMPNCTAIWMAAGCLWMLDASINVSMGPFRAFVADRLPSEQVATGYSTQSFMIGIGGAFGFMIAATDWLKLYPALSQWGPSSLHWQFYICAAIYMVSILVTVFTTSETPPTEQDRTNSAQEQSVGNPISRWLAEMKFAFTHMPQAMRQLCLVQFFTWTGLFCFWIYYTIAVAHHVYGATDPHSHQYQLGVEAAGRSMSIYQFTSTGFSLVIPFLAARLGRAWTHCLGLLCAGLGLLAVSLWQDPAVLNLAMLGVGIGWGTVLSMPFAILVDHIPDKQYGVFMGVFNLFIVLPEILAALFLGPIVKNWFAGNEMLTITMGGGFMLVAAMLMSSLAKQNRSEASLSNKSVSLVENAG